MDLYCPHCKSRDLKKASLAYQEGLYRVNTRTRIIGFLMGGVGPGVLAGTARTRGIHQTEISKLLNPPVKWSYLKLVLWSGGISILALIVYVIHVNSTPPPVSSLPAQLYVICAPIVLAFFLFVFWRHNRIAYQAQHIQWERSFICQRCGAVSLHDVPHSSYP
jgi:hypothetical protein